MKHRGKQPQRPGKADVPADRVQRPSDVSPKATRGGDKESNEPLPRPLKGSGQPHSTPSRKPTR